VDDRVARVSSGKEHLQCGPNRSGLRRYLCARQTAGQNNVGEQEVYAGLSLKQP
jgi:hypothetical protein